MAGLMEGNTGKHAGKWNISARWWRRRDRSVEIRSVKSIEYDCDVSLQNFQAVSRTARNVRAWKLYPVEVRNESLIVWNMLNCVNKESKSMTIGIQTVNYVSLIVPWPLKAGIVDKHWGNNGMRHATSSQPMGSQLGTVFSVGPRRCYIRRIETEHHGNLVFQIGGVSDETVKYGYGFRTTRTIEWLQCKLQTRPLDREGPPQKQDCIFQTATFRQEVISGYKSQSGLNTKTYWLTDRQS
jgi:hypothetical protein